MKSLKKNADQAALFAAADFWSKYGLKRINMHALPDSKPQADAI